MDELVEERLRHDKERIGKLEESCARLTELSIQMGEILKFQNRELSEHSKRLERIERRPGLWVDALRSSVTAAAVSLAVTLLFGG